MTDVAAAKRPARFIFVNRKQRWTAAELEVAGSLCSTRPVCCVGEVRSVRGWFPLRFLPFFLTLGFSKNLLKKAQIRVVFRIKY